MFKKLKELLQGVLTQDSYRSGLERYIASKRPTNPAELEYVIRSYDRQVGGRYGY
jgi:hypothetical protein